MLQVSLAAFALLAATVVIHSVGLAGLLRLLMRSRSRPPTRLWPITRLLIGLTCLLIVTHVIEISVWALFYLWQDCMPDAETAFYFSGTTYTTIGYGDVVLPAHWRMLGPVQGLTGILMCGLSTGFFFAVVSRIYASRPGAPENVTPARAEP